MGRYVIRSPTPDLARSIARTPRIRDKRALALAQDAMKDIAGCMIAGAKDEATRRTRTSSKGFVLLPMTMPSEMLVEIDIEAAIPKDEYKAA